MGEWNSEPVRVFHGRTIPEPGTLAGYATIWEPYDLSVPLPPRLAAIAQRHRGRPFNPRRLEGKLLSDWQSSVIRDARPDARPATRRALEDHQTPESLPAYSDFLLDRLGLIWVAHYGIKGEEVFDWDVFDPAGAYLASLKIPSRFRPTEIGADYLLGVTTDDMAVERVSMYSLSR